MVKRKAEGVLSEDELKKYDKIIDLASIEIFNLNINTEDIKILLYCLRKRSVAELQKLVDLAYKNLLPHVKKLESYGFIKIKDYGKGKQKEITTNFNDKRVKAFVVLMVEHLEDFRKEAK